jgi:Fe-S cluster assembly scaffold protein SufB
MSCGSARDDCSSDLERQARKAAVTRGDEDRVVQGVLARYGHRVGETVVEDDLCLGRLLATLNYDLEGREVRDYLYTFLVA